MVLISTFLVVNNISGEGKNDPKTRAIAKEYVFRSSAVVEDWNVLPFLELLPKLIHDDNTIDKLTLEQQISIVPKEYCHLLKGENESVFIKGDSESLFSVDSGDTKEEKDEEVSGATKPDDVDVGTK